MSSDSEQILHRLAPLSASASFSVAHEFLNASDTMAIGHPLAGLAGDERMVRQQEILSTWVTRHQNAMRKGLILPGIDDFIEKLKSLPSETVLTQAAFRQGTTTGLFWFVQKTGEPVGYVISHSVEA